MCVHICNARITEINILTSMCTFSELKPSGTLLTWCVLIWFYISTQISTEAMSDCVMWIHHPQLKSNLYLHWSGTFKSVEYILLSNAHNVLIPSWNTDLFSCSIYFIPFSSHDALSNWQTNVIVFWTNTLQFQSQCANRGWSQRPRKAAGQVKANKHWYDLLKHNAKAKHSELETWRDFLNLCYRF